MDSTNRCLYCGGHLGGGSNWHPACHKSYLAGKRKAKKRITDLRAQVNQLLGAIQGSSDERLKKTVRKAKARGGFR